MVRPGNLSTERMFHCFEFRNKRNPQYCRWAFDFISISKIYNTSFLLLPLRLIHFVANWPPQAKLYLSASKSCLKSLPLLCTIQTPPPLYTKCKICFQPSISNNECVPPVIGARILNNVGNYSPAFHNIQHYLCIPNPFHHSSSRLLEKIRISLKLIPQNMLLPCIYQRDLRVIVFRKLYFIFFLNGSFKIIFRPSLANTH